LRIEPPVHEGIDVGLWAGPLDDMRLVVREGDEIPGTGARVDAEYYFHETMLIGPAGDVVFTARLDYANPGVNDSNDFALCVWDGERIRVLYREGDPGPGGFGRFGWQHYSPAAIAPDGSVVFIASWHWRDEHGRDFVADGVWISERSGRTRLIARTGQRIDLTGLVEHGDEGVLEEIHPYYFSISHGAESSNWSESGKLALRGSVSARYRRHEIAFVIDAKAPACPEDVTGDGLVNGDDLAIVLGSWGARPLGDTEGDVSGDVVVSAIDLGRLLAAWGACSSPGSDFASVTAR
jgi:hypothetical protein